MAAKLSVADLLAARPQTAAELASETGTRAGALYYSFAVKTELSARDAVGIVKILLDHAVSVEEGAV